MTNAEEPVFVIESIENYLAYDLSPDDYALKVVVFAVNQKGRSPGVVLKEFLFDSNIENHAGIIINEYPINRYLDSCPFWCI